MSEAYLTNWLAGHPADDRNRFHEVALHEARIASERRDPAIAPAIAPAIGRGLVGRLRAAIARAGIAGVSVTERCDCPVAA